MKHAYAVLTRFGDYFEVYAWSLDEARSEAEAKIEGGDAVHQIKRLFT